MIENQVFSFKRGQVFIGNISISVTDFVTPSKVKSSNYNLIAPVAAGACCSTFERLTQ